MDFGLKILGLLLIATLMATPVGGCAWAEVGRTSAPMAAPSEHPAGCQAHGGKSLPGSRLPRSPQPASASYQCCLTGHDVAVVASSYPTPPSQQGTGATLQITAVRTQCFCNGREVSMVLSADPPGITPLRV